MFDMLAEVVVGFLKNMLPSRRSIDIPEKKTRRSKLLRAKEIEIVEEPGHPSTTASGLECCRACTATIDGVSYQFRLIFKHNAFDGSKYTKIANDGWIEITGRSNDDPRRIVTAHLNYFNEPHQWRTMEKAWRPVAVKQAVREWLSNSVRERGK